MPDVKHEFEELSRQSSPSFLGELLQYVRENKKWWLLPLLLAVVLLSLLGVLASTGAAPLIYTIF